MGGIKKVYGTIFRQGLNIEYQLWTGPWNCPCFRACCQTGSFLIRLAENVVLLPFRAQVLPKKPQ